MICKDELLNSDFLVPTSLDIQETQRGETGRAYLNFQIIQYILYFDILLCVNTHTLKYTYAEIRMYSSQTYRVVIKSTSGMCTHANIPNMQTASDPLYKT